MARARLRLPAVAALVVGLLAVAACQSDGDEGPDPQVEAFKRERVVTFTPPGGRLEFTGENAEVTSGKPTRAMVMRVYAYDDAESARAGRLAVVDVAEADGWRVTGGRGPSSEVVYGAKELSTGDATLTIDDYYHSGWDGSPAGFELSVRVEGDTCPPFRCLDPLPR